MVKDVGGVDELLQVLSDWSLTMDFSSLWCPGQELTGTYRVHDADGTLIDAWTGAQSIEIDQEIYGGYFASELSMTTLQIEGQRFCSPSAKSVAQPDPVFLDVGP